MGYPIFGIVIVAIGIVALLILQVIIALIAAAVKCFHDLVKGEE